MSAGDYEDPGENDSPVLDYYEDWPEGSPARDPLPYTGIPVKCLCCDEHDAIYTCPYCAEPTCEKCFNRAQGACACCIDYTPETDKFGYY